MKSLRPVRLGLLAALLMSGVSAEARPGPAADAAPAVPADPGALPEAGQLRERLGLKPGAVTVQEPHLSSAKKAVQRRYLGFAAPDVFARLLGPDWSRPGREIEFRALDGFVSRIPVERFAQYRAYLVYAREDGGPFQVDNHAQHEQQVPLGPYYLVWDNLHSAALRAEGGALWPYQVARIALRPSSRTALLPPGLGQGWEAEAALVQKFCLSCHQINGYGGDKMPINLALRARDIDAGRWQQWLLHPEALRPGTAMPGLPDSLPLAERERIAQRLHAYLRALPLDQ